MDKKVVKNISNQDLAIVDIGLCKAGETIEVPSDFHNANFVEVEAKKVETKSDQEVKKGKIKN